MRESQPLVQLDQEAFRRVWRRAVPEDRADCPFTLDAPAPAAQLPAVTPPSFMAPASAPPSRPMSSAPPICLGEQSAGELPELERLLAMVAQARQIYRSLARRWPREPLLARLAAEKGRQARRLSAARFLISGEEPALPAGQLPRWNALPPALRTRHRAEQEAALALFLAANAASDPCLIELYRELGLACQGFAKQIRVRLEQG